MVLLQDASEDAKWTDVEFLKQANEQLVECRRVLKYTYVFGFYLNPTHRQQRDRFEYHQEMLERFTENLFADRMFRRLGFSPVVLSPKIFLKKNRFPASFL